MADLLLELFSEEIPARMQAAAEQHLADILIAHIRQDAVWVKKFSTPRRLALIISSLPEKQTDIPTELKGPKVGAPEAAIQGFLKRTGLTLDQLEQRDGAYFAKIEQKGRPTAEVLKEAIEKTLAEFPWPKSMRWGSGSTNWVRPLHSILCIFDGKVIPVEFAGVKASNTTRGHRFLAPDVITINSASEYEAALEKACVIASRNERREKIFNDANDLANRHSLQVYRASHGLFDEIAGLVEYPVCLIGSIDAKFMDLPAEVLMTVMKNHQKYLSLVDSDGMLSDRFIIVSNMKDADKAIIAGNERVLRARFSDARFFWDADRKKKLEDWAKGLESVTYHAKLGSMADKVERITDLAEKLAPYMPGSKGDIESFKGRVRRAACLSKADLVTGMVGEFPELQGLMGSYYAIDQGETREIADAICNHYKPQGPTDDIPSSPITACIALADKLDTLVGMFAIGEKPTGSKDPFALRRAALGVIRIVLDNGIRLRLRSLIHRHSSRSWNPEQRDSGLHRSDEVGDELLAFIIDRLKVQMKDQGIRHDVIAAVVANGDDDLVRIAARAKALQEFLGTEDGANLLAGYKRAAKIVADEEKKDGITYNASDLDDISLDEPEERALRFAYSPEKNEELLLWERNEQYADTMKWLATLRQPVDQFFNNIMVNCDDPDRRANRLHLLASIRDMMNRVADFSKIEG